MDAERVAPIVIGVDTGGTFTDVFVSNGVVLKLPSTPENPAHAIMAGVRRAGGGPGTVVGHGTTVATNAVLERTGARTALLTTTGFEDVLEIRRQNRPSLYDLQARWPAPLVPADRRFGILERHDYRGDVVRELELTPDELVASLKDDGVEAVAVCLLFSYMNPIHEETLECLLRQRLGSGFPISLSCRLAPRYGEYERTSTTVVNAYVIPIMRRYLRALIQETHELGIESLYVMHSNGGLLDAHSAADRPVQTILSGPAAGVVGARMLAQGSGRRNIITFDMGGTSSDVAVVPGDILSAGQGEIANFPLLMSTLMIETVGAGGGSIASVDPGGGLRVGPESAGANPGPAAYGYGLSATVTDANLVLGRLASAGLLGGTMPLDLERALAAVTAVGDRLEITAVQAAWAIVRLANSNMERAVRAVTLQRGHDPRRFALFAFGGAGPLHAAELAGPLGITEILVPPHPGVMAALGLTVPDLQLDFSRTVLHRLGISLKALETAFQELEQLARGAEHDPLFGPAVLRRSVDARYVGQSFDLRIPYVDDAARLAEAFHAAHRDRYGHARTEASVEIVHVHLQSTRPRLHAAQLHPPWPEAARPSTSRAIWFGRFDSLRGLSQRDCAVWWRPALSVGTRVVGPALLEQYDSATLIPPGWEAEVDPRFTLILQGHAS